MRTYGRIATLISLLGLSATSLFAQGQKQQQNGAEYWFRLEKEMGLQTRYSVDMEIQAMGMVMPSKTYRLDTKTRSETTMPMMNLRMVNLELEEKGKRVSYSLFPDKKKYCLNEDAGEGDADQDPAYKITEEGTEMFEGVTCKKRRVTVSPKEGPAQEMVMLFSPAQKNMPVKMTATAKVETEPGQPPMEITSVVLFKNYLFASPAASLFTIPKDYTRAADMNEILLGSLGGFAAPNPSGTARAEGPGSPQDLNALLRQAQQEAARESAEEARQEGQNKAANEGLQQGLRNLRGLLGN
jgi:hypothetical protein